MKKKVMYLWLVVWGVLMLCSCVEYNGVDNGVDTGDGGETAYLTLRLTQAGMDALFRAASADPNATEDEISVKKVNVFIYKTDGFLVTHQELAGTEFTQGTAISGNNDSWSTSEKIKTTSGPKKIVVGVNLPDAVVSRFRSSGSIATASTVADIIGADISELASTANGIAMFSTAITDATLSADPAGNPVSVEVKRLVAKVTVKEGNALNFDIPGGTLSDLRFSVGNINKEYYPLQQTVAGVVQDPNHTAPMTDWVAWVADKFIPTPADYVAVNASTVGSNRDLIAKYVTENTTDQPIEGATTFASIRANFTPTKYSDETGADKISSNTGTFYTVSLNNGIIKFFDTENDADTYQGLNSGSTKKVYTDGYCYYNVFLNPTGAYNTYRNDFYQITVTKIMGLGNPSPEATDNTPITQSSDMVTSIEILPWTFVEVETEL